MREKTIKLYHVDELSEEARERAVDDARYWNVEHEWWDQDGLLDLSTKEMKARRIKEYPAYTGLIKYDIEAFSVERGRSWYIRFKNVEVMDDNVFRQFLRVPKGLWEKCYPVFHNPNGGVWNRETNTRLTIEHQENGEFTEKERGIIDRAEEIMSDKIEEALTMLESEYEYLLTDEAVIETLQINNYEFTENGKMYY